MNAPDSLRPLIGLRGRKGCGKDTVAGFLIEMAGYRRTALADALKREFYDGIVYTYTLANREPLPDQLRSFAAYLAYCEAHKHDAPSEQSSWPRLGWQAHGSMRRDTSGDDYWIRRATFAPGYVVTDVRLDSEIAAVQAAGGIVWLIERPGLARTDGHASEIHADDPALPYDLRLVNGGTLDDLRIAVTAYYATSCELAQRHAAASSLLKQI